MKVNVKQGQIYYANVKTILEILNITKDQTFYRNIAFYKRSIDIEYENYRVNNIVSHWLETKVLDLLF